MAENFVSDNPGRDVQRVGTARFLGEEPTNIHQPVWAVTGSLGDSQCYLGVTAKVQAVHEAIKGTPWEGANVYLGGTAATYKDMHDGSNFDLMIAGISAATLIFIIMLVITRSVVAACVIVGTVLLSLGASFGLSVLLWQYILGIKLHWMVLAMAVIETVFAVWVGRER